MLDGMVKGSAAAPGAVGQPGAAPQQAAFEGGKIAITPDKATNSLVVLASPTDYQNLLQVIQKLDKRRRQVFVQAMIAEISLEKLKDIGMQWGMLGAASDGKYATVVGQYDPQGTISTILSTLGSSGISSLVTIPSTGTRSWRNIVMARVASSRAMKIPIMTMPAAIHLFMAGVCGVLSMACSWRVNSV